MQREHIIPLTALALVAWGCFLIYDMNELKKTLAFQQKAEALQRESNHGDKAA